MMWLEESQLTLARALLDSRADEDAALTLFRGSPASVKRRLACYRSNIFHTWEKALANAYPVLKALVGDSFFCAMTHRYGYAYPSHSGDINRFGEDFPVFLTEFAPVAAYPYFPDIARLEWQLHCAYYATNHLCLSAADWATLTPEAAAMMQLTLHPACALLASDWAVGDIWHAHQPGAKLDMLHDIRHANYTLVARPTWRPTVLLLSEAAYRILTGLQAGQTFATAVKSALEIDPHFDLSTHLTQWTAQSVFIKKALPMKHNN